MRASKMEGNISHACFEMYGLYAAATGGLPSSPGLPTSGLGPRVLTVGGNYQFPSIGLAIEAASPGDNIVVFEGHYREAITLTKPLEVRSSLPSAIRARAWFDLANATYRCSA